MFGFRKQLVTQFNLIIRFFLNHHASRASSILQKNSKLYGPKNALDYENTSTSWNSEGSSSDKTSQLTSYVVEFGRLVQPLEFKIQFQAGFAAEQTHIFVLDSDETWKPIVELDTEDDHKIQEFSLLPDVSNELVTTKALKVVFDECTDFYNRIIVYQLQVLGYEANNSGLSISK